jgi:hypothetical protein
MRRTMQRPISVKVEPELHAAFPEICRLHGHASIGSIIRKLLHTEAARLGIKVNPKRGPALQRGRFTT